MLTKKTQTLPKRFDFYIGIDPGVNTGIARWNRVERKFEQIYTASIVQVMDDVKAMMFFGQDKFLFRIEDARKRKWFGNSGREQLQGAGSIKRDCQIWEEFLNHCKANYEFVAPKNNKTKLDSKRFKQLTKWEKQTNEHSRDAAMLVFGL